MLWFLWACSAPVDTPSFEPPRPGVDRSAVVYDLLRLEQRLRRDCAGEDGAAWFDQQVAPLDNLLETIRERLNKQGISDWSQAPLKEARYALKIIDSTMYQHGFVICVPARHLSQTLQPRLFSLTEGGGYAQIGEEVCTIRSAPSYRLSALLDQEKIRPLDCDIGAMMYLSVGDLPIEAVEVPGHTFVRWTLPDGSVFNWDVNQGREFSDDDYRTGRTGENLPFDTETEKAGRYLQGRTHKELLDYFYGAVFQEVEHQSCLDMALSDYATGTVEGGAFEHMVAWRIATHVPYAAYAEHAVSMASQAARLEATCTRWSVLSCAYAAAGDFERAMTIERIYISETSPRIQPFAAGRTCYEPEVAASMGCVTR